jgi:hypothetical protein
LKLELGVTSLNVELRWNGGSLSRPKVDDKNERVTCRPLVPESQPHLQ